MPQVPYRPFPSVMPEGQLAPQRIEANPADFGAQVGETLQQNGNELMENAVRRQMYVNQANAEELYSTGYIPAMAKLANEFYQLRGQAAQEAVPDYTQKLIDLQREYASQLPSPFAQQQFNSMSKNRQAYEIERMSKFGADQSNTWQLHANDSVINSFVLDGIQHWNDPRALAANAQKIVHQAEYFGALHGIDEATTQGRWTNALYRMHYGAITQTAQTDPAAAEQMLQKYNQYLSSNPNGIRALEEMIGHGNTQAKQRAEDGFSQYVYSKFNLGDPQVDVGQATAWSTDPDNYTKWGLDADGANKVAGQIQAQWNREREFRAEQQKAVNDNFLRAATVDKSVVPTNFSSWKDQQTGLAPDLRTLNEAVRIAATPAKNLQATDPMVGSRLIDGIYGIGASDGRPRITSADQLATYIGKGLSLPAFEQLRGMINGQGKGVHDDVMRQVLAGFDKRYADASGNLPPEVAGLKYGFLTRLNEAVKGGNLKGPQVLDYVKKMYETVDKEIIDNRWDTHLYNPDPGSAKNPLTPNEGIEHLGDKATSDGPAPSARETAPPSPGIAWTKAYIQKTHPEVPLTDGNVQAAYQQFLKQDPHFWQNWK